MLKAKFYYIEEIVFYKFNDFELLLKNIRQIFLI